MIHLNLTRYFAVFNLSPVFMSRFCLSDTYLKSPFAGKPGLSGGLATHLGGCYNKPLTVE
ncbi:hypothetical protein X474_20090 [Dethiosulfatarculus sandiegensis]|uniref:Uncharacterized protein n=1 Tax=Dethiosulfatarculus sandiegensis TaxID=1429043 RepID=A0A0D2JRZ9_9BACT|nr:hypothetical protein X474_20090 [Dethiosulfatarculus sandiegensis]